MSSNRRGSKKKIKRPKKYHDEVVTGKEGVETVIFDEEIVNKGSIKWRNTICGI